MFRIKNLALWCFFLPNLRVAFHEDVLAMFDYLAKQTLFSYVLLGHKPMAFESLYKGVESKIYTCSPVMFRKWWQVWENEKIKIDDKFILRVEDDNIICFMNKPLCQKMIAENFDLFSSLGKSSDEVSHALFNCKNVWKFLNYDDRLIGILLGFGRANAIAFYERYNEFAVVDLKPFHQEDPNHGWFFSQPRFVVTDCSETEELRKTYSQDQNDIVKAYHDRFPGEVFLKRLLGKDLRILLHDKFKSIDVRSPIFFYKFIAS